MFQYAIVRTPCPEMVHGITIANLGSPDYVLATIQHSKYIEALQSCGLEVRVLDPDSRFPDSTFVEDVALCTQACAILTNPGAPSRNGEKDEMAPVLASYYNNVATINSPGTLDAGDVMMCGDHYFIGLSGRTNDEGADQLIKILAHYNLTASKVPLTGMLHLKSGFSYLENGIMLVCSEFIEIPTFDKYTRILVDPDETYAANSLWINETVLVPAGFPKTLSKIQKAGYKTIVLEVSEFQKLDGGLSCLSLRF